MSLVEYAKREMQLAGLDKRDSDYGGMIYHAVLELIEVHSQEGHSGMSSQLTVEIFNKLVNFKPLTPISSNPDEWMKIAEGPDETLHQSIRNPSLFSSDGGKTWYDIDDKKKRNWPKRKWYQKYFLDKLK